MTTRRAAGPTRTVFTPPGVKLGVWIPAGRGDPEDKALVIVDHGGLELPVAIAAGLVASGEASYAPQGRGRARQDAVIVDGGGLPAPEASFR